MSMPPPYQEALARPPRSVMLAFLPATTTLVGVTEAQAHLRESGLCLARVGLATERRFPDARWELTVSLEADEGEAQALTVWLEPAPRDVVARLAAHGVGKGDLEAAERSAWAIGTSSDLSPDPVARYHRQLQVLSALAPDAVLVLDEDALAPRSGDWLREAGRCVVPPSPNSLFTIHCVCADDSERAWLHTHGLLRCGSVELELLDMPVDSAGLFGQLVNAVAGLFLDEGVPEPGQVFEAGQDLLLTWLPWEEAVRKVGAHAAGGKRDRDEPHSGTSGVLFAPRRGFFGLKYESPAVYAKLLSHNPMLYVSTAETARMALLARERLPRFAAVLRAHGGRAGFKHLVKLGYPMDGSPNGAEREHLWFEAHGIDGERVEATLLNAPYHVAHLKEGDRGFHDLALLSDWIVLTSVGRFGPDTIHELERRLTVPPPATA